MHHLNFRLGGPRFPHSTTLITYLTTHSTQYYLHPLSSVTFASLHIKHTIATNFRLQQFDYLINLLNVRFYVSHCPPLGFPDTCLHLVVMAAVTLAQSSASSRS